MTMINYHPDQFLLTDYSAGSVPCAFALPIAVHMQYCGQCRDNMHELNDLGASLFDTLDPVPVADDALDTVLGLIAGQEDVACPGPCDKPESSVPNALQSLVPDGLETVSWKRVTSTLSVSRLRFGDQDREVALHYIKSGGKVSEHTHAGNEITVVVKGSFSDQHGVYQKGDFILRTPSDKHRPVADQGEDCICLSVLDAPIKFDGFWSRMLNPMLRLHPA